MLHDMDDMKGGCILYVMVGMFDPVKESKVCVLTITKIAIAKLIVQHVMILSLSFMQDPWDFLGQTLPDIVCLEE